MRAWRSHEVLESILYLRVPQERGLAVTTQLITAALLGALLRDLMVLARDRYFCWHRRRQTQRAAAAAREKAKQRRQEILANTSADTLTALPFVIEPRNDF